ncbi:MAG: hypothetical protein ACK4HB_02275 [Candidatus Bipolaricaulia bacterium]
MKIFVALSVSLLTLALPVTAQSFNPIIEENGVDGLLLGAEGSYRFFDWLEPSLGLAYGLQSQKIRYRAGLSFWDVKVMLLDWPRTPVLGRIGEAGLKATFKPPFALPTLSGFVGTIWPWPHDPNPPDVAYVMYESSRSLHAPFGIELGFSQRALIGWWQLGVLPSQFQYSQTQLSLRRELFSFTVSYGTLENESNLPDFIFVQTVKGESTTLKGDRFWAVQFERDFEVISVSVPMPLLSQALELRVHGGVFVHVVSAGKIELPSDGQGEGKRVWQNQLSWGLSVLVSPNEMGLKARVDFVFTRSGQFRFLFSF